MSAFEAGWRNRRPDTGHSKMRASGRLDAPGRGDACLARRRRGTRGPRATGTTEGDTGGACRAAEFSGRGAAVSAPRAPGAAHARVSGPRPGPRMPPRSHHGSTRPREQAACRARGRGILRGTPYDVSAAWAGPTTRRCIKGQVQTWRFPVGCPGEEAQLHASARPWRALRPAPCPASPPRPSRTRMLSRSSCCPSRPPPCWSRRAPAATARVPGPPRAARRIRRRAAGADTMECWSPCVPRAREHAHLVSRLARVLTTALGLRAEVRWAKPPHRLRRVRARAGHRGLLPARRLLPRAPGDRAPGRRGRRLVAPQGPRTQDAALTRRRRGSRSTGSVEPGQSRGRGPRAPDPKAARYADVSRHAPTAGAEPLRVLAFSGVAIEVGDADSLTRER